MVQLWQEKINFEASLIVRLNMTQISPKIWHFSSQFNKDIKVNLVGENSAKFRKIIVKSGLAHTNKIDTSCMLYFVLHMITV
jgi:hypothetical protein